MSCLNILEIRHEIFEYVFATTGGHRDLAALARTCRAYHVPALSILWRTHKSLVPLILCFPSDMLDLSTQVGRYRDIITVKLKFAKLPSLKDWERPLMHAKFIRELTGWDQWYGRKEYDLRFTTLETLFDSCPASPLFPTLRYLDLSYCRILPTRAPRSLHSDAQVASAYLRKIACPAVLQSLRMYNGTPSRNTYDCRSLLALVLELYPTIKSLAFHDNVNAGPVDGGLALSRNLTIVGSFRSLTSFTVKGSLPESFNLVPSFPTLLKLDISCSVSSALKILKAILSPGLRQIRFWLYPSDRVLELCAVLASRASWRDSLRYISIVDPFVCSQALETLFALSHLCYLDLSCSTIDDSLLERAARAWPMLERFFVSDGNIDCPPRPTLQSLVSFSRHCPHLTHLSLPLDARQIPSPRIDVNRSEISRGISGSSMVRDARPVLKLTGHVTVSDPAGMAGFLLDLFPGITFDPTPYDDLDDECHLMSKEVAQIINQRRPGQHC
ncbi:hypothetical protein JVU11DRAFT_7763 [Chiua virens]|nr:hypothetical protein JVU11DRAFT_7763 [Chiua virens]